MKKELLEFINANNLSPFNLYKTQVTEKGSSIFKTRDAKTISNRTLTKISEYFMFADTSNLLYSFFHTNNPDEIKRRQEFFMQIKSLGKKDNRFLRTLEKPQSYWKPPYDVVVVTENTDTFNLLKEMNCPAQLLISETDVALLESRDIVQVIDCDQFGMILESLPQAVFLNSPEEAYVERFLETLSGWKKIIDSLKNSPINQDLKGIVQELLPLTKLATEEKSDVITPEKAEEIIQKINGEVNYKLEQLTVSGSSLVDMLSRGILPPEIKETIEESIIKYEIPESIVNKTLPLTLDEEELDKLIKSQSANEFSGIAEGIKSYASELKEVPKKLKTLKDNLILFDFITGITQFINEEMTFPRVSDKLRLDSSKNILLDNPQPITFFLNYENHCSILTGANSGGKTTLLEHVIQSITLFQIGLPVSGRTEFPMFTDIYYFAKNKGSMSKGAFETLLTQMSKIKPGNKTLILADEIEAVTEPGVAGNIIAATAEYYIEKNCYLIIATHLGHEIKKVLPNKTRIDGIEAKGLTEYFDLIVDHNPVLGKLASSTPELIVEKMANKEQGEYFLHLNNFLKNKDSNSI